MARGWEDWARFLAQRRRFLSPDNGSRLYGQVCFSPTLSFLGRADLRGNLGMFRFSGWVGALMLLGSGCGLLQGQTVATGAGFSEEKTADGYRGIWYSNQPTGDEYVYKYSGGFATYPQQHAPIAIYSARAGKTFFCYGGRSVGKRTSFRSWLRTSTTRREWCRGPQLSSGRRRTMRMITRR